jgi:hypothetical protein
MRKIIASRATAGALAVLCRGKGSPAGSPRPRPGSLLAAAVVVVLGLAGAAPAMANTAPSMITSGNDVNIAFEGADHSLLFFWAANGTTTWHKQTVAGTDTTGSAPSMTNDGNDVNIAASGFSGGLDFYWAVNGTTTWNFEQVAPPGTVG